MKVKEFKEKLKHLLDDKDIYLEVDGILTPVTKVEYVTAYSLGDDTEIDFVPVIYAKEIKRKRKL